MVKKGVIRRGHRAARSGRSGRNMAQAAKVARTVDMSVDDDDPGVGRAGGGGADGAGGAGTLTVRTARHDDRLPVEFRDTGPGVPPETRDHVIDPSFTTEPVGEGTGPGPDTSWWNRCRATPASRCVCH
jgi:hypothetical protein